MTYANVVVRWVARCIDAVVLALVAVVLMVPSFVFRGSDWLALLTLAAIYGLIAAYQIVPLALGGASLGMRIVGIKAVMENGKPVGWEKAILRALYSLLSSLFCSIGFIAALWTKKTQTWHDQLAGTVVIYVTPEKGGKTKRRKAPAKKKAK